MTWQKNLLHECQKWQFNLLKYIVICVCLNWEVDIGPEPDIVYLSLKKSTFYWSVCWYSMFKQVKKQFSIGTKSDIVCFN